MKKNIKASALSLIIIISMNGLQTISSEIAPKQQLYDAIKNNEISVVTKLILRGIDPNIGITPSSPPIIVSSRYNQNRITQALIDAGADINAIGGNGLTSLMIAAREGFPGVVRKLLRAGADLEKTDSQKNSALILALRNLNHQGCVENGRKKVVRRLILNGALVPSDDEMQAQHIQQAEINFLRTHVLRWQSRRYRFIHEKLQEESPEFFPKSLEDLILAMESKRN